MTCRCGARAEYDERGLDNGAVCQDCETFTCTNCFARFASATAGYADTAFCAPCNRAYSLLDGLECLFCSDAPLADEKYCAHHVRALQSRMALSR